MVQILTAGQMQALERAALDDSVVSGLELMERAGRGIVDAIFAHWPELAQGSHRVAVLCGPGNNGGDGYVVARLLQGWGWEVTVYQVGNARRAPPEARANAEAWRALGPVLTYAESGKNAIWLGAVPQVDLIVDAIFGLGLSRPVEGVAHLAGLLAGPERPRVVAVDLPSGLCADSGRSLGTGQPLSADLTVTFHAAKPAHYLAAGLCGALHVVDLGLGEYAAAPEGVEALARSKQPDLSLATAQSGDLLANWRCWLDKGGAGKGRHKFDHGHVLVLAGGPGQGGAARLAARAALRSGAGLVTVGAPPEAIFENAARLDAVMLRVVVAAEDLGRLLEDRRINVVALGPGLGIGERARWLVAQALESEAKVVLDADALTSFSADPGTLFALTRAHGGVVMTPHEGEFSRMFPDLGGRMNGPVSDGPAFSRIDAARAAAERAGAVVVLKGQTTVIAAPDGTAVLHAAVRDTAAPWLATAGAGDVLAGILAGLLARHLPMAEAAGLAAWLHVQAARRFGPGLIAEDLAEQLPGVFAGLNLGDC